MFVFSLQANKQMCMHAWQLQRNQNQTIEWGTNISVNLMFQGKPSRSFWFSNIFHQMVYQVHQTTTGEMYILRSVGEVDLIQLPD